MVIQWGYLAKCQGTRKDSLEFRPTDFSSPPAFRGYSCKNFTFAVFRAFCETNFL